MVTGRIFNIQRFTLHDGPGLRTTVFLKGCPARCVWCHNPESQSSAPQLLRFPERCISCGTCTRVCPNGTDPARCTACGLCADACPAEARQLAGRTLSVADVLRTVERDRPFFDESGGGLTISGGEPLSQPAFVLALLGAAKAAGISTALDTCGAGSREALLAVAPLADVVLYDLKLTDDRRHLEYTGVPLGPIVSNLSALGSVHGNIWLRVPIVPGFTDDEPGLEAAARIAASTPGVRRVHLLPYHRTGTAKFARLGTASSIGPVEPPGGARMRDLARIFERRAIETFVGG